MSKSTTKRNANNKNNSNNSSNPFVTKVEDDEWFANSGDSPTYPLDQPTSTATAITINDNSETPTTTNNSNNNHNNNASNSGITDTLSSLLTNNATANSISASLITSLAKQYVVSSFTNAFSTDEQKKSSSANATAATDQSSPSSPPSPMIMGAGLLSQYFVFTNERVILSRLLSTVYRPFQAMNSIFAQPDLYGPLMTVFSFSILLNFFLSIHQFDSFPGAVMSFALTSVLLYWSLVSMVLYVTCRMLSVRDLSLVSVLSTVGYSMFPLLLVGCLSSLPFGTIFGAAASENLVWNLKLLTGVFWLGIGVSSALNLGRTFMVRTPDKMNALIMMGICVAIQLLCVLVVGGIGARSFSYSKPPVKAP